MIEVIVMDRKISNSALSTWDQSETCALWIEVYEKDAKIAEGELKAGFQYHGELDISEDYTTDMEYRAITPYLEKYSFRIAHIDEAIMPYMLYLSLEEVCEEIQGELNKMIPATYNRRSVRYGMRGPL